MSWDQIKNPNVEIVGVSATYDSTKPVKRWVDHRALDPANEDEGFIYNKLIRTPDGATATKTFVLSRQDAGTANIPPVDTGFSNTSLWNPKEMPLPVREIRPDEMVILDPFGAIILKKVSEQPISGADLFSLHEKLDRIIQKLGA